MYHLKTVSDNGALVQVDMHVMHSVGEGISYHMRTTNPQISLCSRAV